MRKPSAILEDTSVADREKALKKAEAELADAQRRLAELKEDFKDPAPPTEGQSDQTPVQSSAPILP